MKPCNYNPELSLDPPYPDEDEYQRNLRNGLRDEICDAISLIDSRLGELEPQGHGDFLMDLGRLREFLRLDYEG